jgi:hypothetical protein
MELASTIGLQRRYLPEQAIARLSTHHTAEVVLHKGPLDAGSQKHGICAPAEVAVFASHQ